MGEGSEELGRKASKMLRLLLVQRGGRPGVKGWELKRHFGTGYPRVLEVAKVEAEKLGLELRVVEDDENRGPDFSRYMLVASESVAELGFSPLTIVDSAVLAMILALSYGGRRSLPLKEVEAVLSPKIPHWRIGQALSKLSRLGYIELEDDSVKVSWRSRAEVDVERLAKTLFLVKPGGSDRQSP